MYDDFVNKDWKTPARVAAGIVIGVGIAPAGMLGFFYGVAWAPMAAFVTGLVLTAAATVALIRNHRSKPAAFGAGVIAGIAMGLIYTLPLRGRKEEFMKNKAAFTRAASPHTSATSPRPQLQGYPYPGRT